MKIFIDYLAYISNVENLSDEVGNMFTVIQEHFKDIELSIFNQLFLEELKASIKEKEETLHLAILLGTSRLIYDFSFNGKRETRNLDQVIKTLKYTAVYFEEAEKQLSKPKLILKFDELPDFLTYEEVMGLTGWTKKTIQSKHSKLDLASVEGLGQTPKQGLLDYYMKRIKGVQIDPVKWFNDTLHKNKVLPKK
jgi:hypothetical protein